MSTIANDSESLERSVWVQRAGRTGMCVSIGPNIKIIEDLKRILYGDSRDQYLIFYRQQNINLSSDIPNDTLPSQMIQFKRIVPDQCELFLINHFSYFFMSVFIYSISVQ